jgi:hypothetical protein
MRTHHKLWYVDIYVNIVVCGHVLAIAVWGQIYSSMRTCIEYFKDSRPYEVACRNSFFS